MKDTPENIRARELLKDKDVRRWYENMRRSSVNTAMSMLRRLSLFCRKINMTPREFAELGKTDPLKAENILIDFVEWMEECEYSPGYMECIIKAVRSWVNHNRVDFKIKIRLNNARASRTIANEPNPTPADIRRMLEMANPRARVIISMMAFTGMRPQVMGNADGTDGLVLGDFPELVLDGDSPYFTTMPAQVLVRRSVSKNGSKYVTFLLRAGCDIVTGYLRERMLAGEVLTPQTPLIRPLRGCEARRRAEQRMNQFVSTATVRSSINDIVKAILPIRVYSLRGYFDSQLLLAESNGYMTHAYRQFFMGHKGDIEARYTTNKGRLTEQMLDDMRRCYENSEWYLYPDSDIIQKSKKENFIDVVKKQAELQGIDVSEVINAGALERWLGESGAGDPRAGAGNGGAAGAGAPGPGAPHPAPDGAGAGGGSWCARAGDPAPDDTVADGVQDGAQAGDPAYRVAPRPGIRRLATGGRAASNGHGSQSRGNGAGNGRAVTASNGHGSQSRGNGNGRAGDGPAEPGAGTFNIVSGEEELLHHMNNGWSLAKELANGRYLIRRDDTG